MILRARVVLPVTRPPIDDGAVLISGNRIRTVCGWRDLTVRVSEQVVALGDRVLLPGFVNAHCHLDYTDLAGEIPATKTFTDWIKSITAAKAGKIYADFAQSWLRGAQMLLRTGTTTVADIESVPELLPEVWLATPLRVFSFIEMTGVKSRREPRFVLDDAVRKIESLPVSRGGAGLSPHAPYSTMPELLKLSAATAREKGWRLVTHVAESDLELEMFMHARGEMFDWLQWNERDMSDCGLGSPVQHLERHGYLAGNLLAVHVNYLAPGDAALLERRGVSVAHCPRSHVFFQHHRFPREKLAGVGVNICLGTDSLASVSKVRGRPMELNLFTEMQTFAAGHPDVPPETIVRMATLNGARALGLQGKIGELSENAMADLIAVPFTGNCADAFEAAVHHVGDVAASMIDGEWVRPPAP